MYAKFNQTERNFKEELLTYKEKLKLNDQTIRHLTTNNEEMKYELEKLHQNNKLLVSGKQDDNEMFNHINVMKEKYLEREVTLRLGLKN